MPHQEDLKEKVLVAVRELAQSINSGKNVDIKLKSLESITSQLTLSNIDVLERLIRSEYYINLEARSPSKIMFWRQATLIPNWIDLCCYDGFKREKALQSISGPAPNSFFFALTLRRLNDWVAQVREAACKALPNIAKHTSPELIVEALLALLPHWSSWGRMGETEKQVLFDVISMDKVLHTLKIRIITSPSGPMATILSQIGRLEAMDKYFFEVACNSIQPSVRAKSYRSILEGKIVWVEGKKWEWTDKRFCVGQFKPILGERKIITTRPFLDILKMASKDRSPIVRRIAGEVIIGQLEQIDSELLNLAQLLALDPSPSVAERGRFVIKNRATPSHESQI